eukprot:4994281-Alexandrium_andersonii.AAC.1
MSLGSGMTSDDARRVPRRVLVNISDLGQCSAVSRGGPPPLSGCSCPPLIGGWCSICGAAKPVGFALDGTRAVGEHREQGAAHVAGS